MSASIKEKPIIFSGPMVKAILAGQKTQTRRVIKPQPNPEHWQSIQCGWYEPTVVRKGMQEPGAPVYGFASEDEGWKCPYGPPGERLWVRETCWLRPERTPRMMREGVAYKADCSEQDNADFKRWGFKHCVSIFMPRWASRILLEIVSIRVERLQAITETDALMEGFKRLPATGRVVLSPGGQYAGNVWSSARVGFTFVWDALHSDRGHSWSTNPWVWVVEFKRVETAQAKP